MEGIKEKVVQTDHEIDRYPGPKPFDENSNALFFGRSAEIKELFEAINVHQVYLIHGESGLGKSSLINAGLIPKLKEEGYLPLLFRFKQRDKTLIENILSELHISFNGVEAINSEPLPAFHMLWYYIKQYNFEGKIPVFIFDQFEEFSIFSKDEQQEFYSEVASIFSPDNKQLIAKLSDGEDKDQDWFLPANVKLVFSLRSDNLMVVEDLYKYLPALQRNRFKLKPILWEFARQLIVQPALIESTENLKFYSPPFIIDQEVTENILKVTRDGKADCIETTQMQMICQEIELFVKDKPNKNQGNSITNDDFSLEKLYEITSRFYQRQLGKIKDLPEVSEIEFKAIRLIIESKLLVRGKRTPLTKDTLTDCFIAYFKERKKRTPESGEPDELILIYSQDENRSIDNIILKLLEFRIIRDQPYGNQVFYEISHDTLIPGILNELDARLKEEHLDLLRQEKEKISEENRAKQAFTDLNNKKIFLRRCLIAFAVLTIFSFAFFIIRSIITRKENDLVLTEKKILLGDGLIREGKQHYENKVLSQAFNSFRDAGQTYNSLHAYKIIDSLPFAELTARTFFPSSDNKIVVSFLPGKAFTVYDIIKAIPKKIFSSKGIGYSQPSISPKGKYLYVTDPRNTSYLISLKNAHVYDVNTKKISDWGYFKNESCFYYKTDLGYSFYTLPGFNKSWIAGLEFLGKLNPIDNLNFSSNGKYVYVKKGNQNIIYNVGTSQKIATLPKNIYGFNFHDKQPVYYYFESNNTLVVHNFDTNYEMKLPTAKHSYVGVIGDRLIVKNNKTSRIFGIEHAFQFSYAINLATNKIFKVPDNIYRSNIIGFSGEKYLVYKRLKSRVLYNVRSGKNIEIDLASSIYTDNESNLVYYLDSEGYLNQYNLNNDSIHVFSGHKMEKFTINNLRTKVAFQDKVGEIKVLDLKSGAVKLSDFKGEVISFLGPLVEIQPAVEPFSEYHVLVNPEGFQLKGKAKVDFWSNVYKKRND
ncbi:ATP-binding protein [Pedobacter alluvionis]|uniref:ATP-binding protein n=1 Tax=Pedobacter alluvionis TaxID=475253 RepID=A0A497YCL2_9SPHI|nr:ATP-binding protein [Pedobacter alluvionis]RLJ80226.1 hypothetical protein BCL90_0976 [Pedobacter alluvionis]TFB31506.1 ATP-binding protein [Pedobacter alluvionis]